MQTQLQTLRELLSQKFSKSELRTLCFDLGIDSEQASGESKDDLALYLIDSCRREGRLAELVALCRQRRLRVNWPDLPDDELDDTALAALLKAYAAEIKATFDSFWSAYVALGDDNPSFAQARRPLDGLFAYEAPAKRESKSAGKPGDKAEVKEDTRQDEQKTDMAKESVARSGEELSSLQHVYEALMGQSAQSQRGSITLLIAEPGAGKTLWLRYRATQLAGHIEEPDAPIPIYLPLNAYRGEEDLGAFIVAALAANEHLPAHRQLAAGLGAVMKRRPLWLLLDGLNEISETAADGVPPRRRFIRTLPTFVQQHQADCLLATRPTEFVAGLDWPTITIRPLDRLGVMSCLASYAPDAALDIYRILDDQNLFGPLTSNPYRVRALCRIYKPGRGLPENLGALFEAFVVALVNREQERRVAQGGQWPPFDSWAPGVGELARVLTDSEATAIEPGRLPERFRDPDAWSYAEAAGLLHLRDGRLQFSHQQLQEYFAARWLKTGLEAYGTDWNGFGAACRKRSWDQPLLLLAGIADPALLDSLIAPLAAVDPFLACSCVGVDPGRVSAATRQWLADYVARGLVFATENRDGALAELLARAAGEMRCAEGLGALLQPAASYARKRAGADYYRAVAQANTDEAADFLIAAIEEAATTREPDWSREVLKIVRALAGMRVPAARRFLARSLYDRRIYPEVLTVLGEVDTGIGYGQLKTLLAHNQFPHPRDGGTYFDALAAAAARVAPRALLPDLTRHADKPAAVAALLCLGAGQRIIDAHVKRHNFRMRRQAWLADAWAFGIDWIRPDSTALIDLRNYLYAEVGEKAAGDFVDLLLAAATQAGYDNQTPLAAVQALALMRHSRVLPALKALLATDSSADEKEKPYYSRDRSAAQLRQMAKSAIEFLEEPRGLGIFNSTLDRFALALRSWGVKPGGQTLPGAAKELLDCAHRDQEQFERFAAEIVDGAPDEIRGSGYRSRYGHGELFRSATRYLSERDRPELPAMLLRILVAAAEDGGKESAEWIAAAAELMAEHGRRGPAQKQSIAARLAPLVHRPNRPLQLAAVRVLALIDAHEQSAEWLEYLSDRTWPLAYAIVDALGCLTIPAATLDLLAARLQSAAADERYFAVLALGSIGCRELRPRVLELGADPDVEVRRAVLWAVSQLDAADPPDPRLIQILADGLASPHARLRREAANTIGVLGLPALNRELRPLLADSDLRVVERAAWALGRLGDRDSVPQLMIALTGVTWQDTLNYQPGLRQRVEFRLKETIATSLAQIRVGVNKDAVLNQFEREKGMFTALVAGRLDEDAWGRLDRRAAEHPGEAAEGEATAPRPALETLAREELETVACRAADPLDRKKALELLGPGVDSYTSYIETIPKHDPVPTVQLEALRIWAGLDQRGDYGAAFTGNPQYDLLPARQLGGAGPALALRIPLPALWQAEKSPAPALWLAQRFPGDYDLKPLLARLCASLETPHHHAPYHLEDNELRTLCNLLERRRLAHYYLAGKITWPAGWYGWGSLPAADAAWIPSVDYLLAQRRVWGIVPRLLEDLGEKQNGFPRAVQALCELGIYQAAELIEDTFERLRPDADTEMAVTQVMAQVELTGGYGRTLPERFNDLDHPYTSDRVYLYLLSNILAESESAQDIDEDLTLAIRLATESDFMDYADNTWLDRRLRRWGHPYLRRLLAALADGNGYFNLIEDAGENLMPYDSHHYGDWRGEKIARAVRRCPEALLRAWLADESWAVRWVAFCGLAAGGSAGLDDHALRLLQDDAPQLFVPLLQRADKERLPALYRFLQGETDLGLGDRNEEVAGLLHQAVERRLRGADQDAKKAVISILADHRTRRFASTLSHVAVHDERDAALAALDALRRLGDRRQAAALRPLLDAPDPGVLKTAIETIAVLRYRPASRRLLQLLDHPDLEVQNAAVGACGLMQIRRAIPHLERRLQLLTATPDAAAPAEGDELEISDEPWSVVETNHREAVDATERALYLLHATPHWSIGGMAFSAGDGLLALVALHWYDIRNDEFYDWNGHFDREFPYPLSLLSLPGAQLIAHAIRRDLRAATWANRRLREVILASTTLFSEQPEAGGTRRPRIPAEGRPATGEEAAGAWVAAILETIESLERQMHDGWDAIRVHWSATVEEFADFDPSALAGDEDISPDLMWPIIKVELVTAFDRLLKRDPDGNGKLLLLFRGLTLRDAHGVLAELGPLSQNSLVAALLSQARSSGETSDGLNDYERQLLAAISDADRVLMGQCHELAKLDVTCALLASWGAVVLQSLREQFANRELEAGYVVRVEPYLWLMENHFGWLSILKDRTASGEKVNPLAVMDAP